MRYRLAAILLVALALFAPARAMDNPGPFPLTVDGRGDFAVTSATTQTGLPQQNLAGIISASFEIRMSYGSGGATVTVYVQTSLDQGQSWIDIAAVQFTTSGGLFVLNLPGATSVTPTAPTDGSLTPGTIVSGILGDQFRAKVISTGTYAGGTLVSVRGVAR